MELGTCTAEPVHVRSSFARLVELHGPLVAHDTAAGVADAFAQAWQPHIGERGCRPRRLLASPYGTHSGQQSRAGSGWRPSSRPLSSTVPGQHGAQRRPSPYAITRQDVGDQHMEGGAPLMV
jgi:hypothetical protein